MENQFFEVNLPATAPAHIRNDAVRARFEDAVSSITRRSDKLNAALQLCAMEPNKFHEIAANLFTRNPGRFESMSEYEIADYCALEDDGVPVKIKRYDWPNATVLFDTAFTTTEEWESLRLLGIGGSECSVVLNASPYTTQRMLYHDKVGTPMAEEERGREAVFDRGHFTEPKVVETFCKLSGAERIPESRMFANKANPHCTANIDALILLDGQVYVFEAKTTIEENRGAWTSDKVPRNYLYQSHQYPAVLDDDRIMGTYISCLFTVDYSAADYFITATFDGPRIISRFIERDPDTENLLKTMEENFWSEYVMEGVEPPYGNGEAELAFSSRMMGVPTNKKAVGLSLGLTDSVKSYLEISDKIKELKDQIKALEDGQKLLRAQFIEALGENIEGHVMINEDSYYEIKNAPTKGRVSVDTEALALFPEAYKACVTVAEAGSPRFSIKKKYGSAAPVPTV